ncbi:glycosyltransferase, partial [Candidatus Falkowbacteria bacterium]|nr:glycosyltransferase [Candidatus Falkowbacteria bacterium]
MFVSAIITTKNEEKHIENCLRSIRDQTYPKHLIEIIVVDNNSDDKTAAIAKQYTEKVFNQGPERSAQRNFGVDQSRGEYFMYLDADMILRPEVITECVELIKKDTAIVGLYVPEVVMGDKFLSQIRRFERSFYDGTVVDCARFIKKQTFQEVGGFDLNFTGPEDWDLDKKLRQKGKTALIKTALDHNESEIELKSYLQKKGYYAKSFDKYIAKWGMTDPDLQKQLGLYYRFLGIFIEKGKWKKLLIKPISTLGMYGLRFLVGLKFIFRHKKTNNMESKEPKKVLILSPFL